MSHQFTGNIKSYGELTQSPTERAYEEKKARTKGFDYHIQKETEQETRTIVTENPPELVRVNRQI